MRIALAADGTRGDVHPLLELGARLRGAGHEVLLLGPPDSEDEAAARGVPFRAVGLAMRPQIAKHAGVVGAGGVRTMLEALELLRTNLEAQFEALPSAVRGCDLVIGASLSLAARSAAELHGIPYRFVAYCPILLPSSEHPAFVVRSQTLPAWVNRLGWWLLMPPVDLFASRLVNRGRRRLGLRPVGSAYRHFLTDRPIVAADRALAPLPRDIDVAATQIPCLHGMQPAPLPAKLESFLEQGPPPVYLGFGSMPDPDPQATTRTLLDAVARVGCRAVISRGWAELGGVPLPDGVIDVGSVSHAALFPRVAAVVHHGGAGTTTTAARAGVPQIVVPHLADQYYWAARVERLGLAPPAILRRRLTAERLAGALDLVLENEILAERARELGARLRAEAAAIDPVAVVLA
jgi:UDP:flavonoid glycosyltransferase YjiC (YdhE family)